MEGKPTIFEFTSYKFEPEKKRIHFVYTQFFKDKAPLIFSESIVLPELVDASHVPAGLLEKLLQDLHLVLGVSYFKFYCATKVKHSYALAKGEADFWNTIYRNGLGEFYYRNKLDPKNAPRFSFDNKAGEKPFHLNKNNRYLVALSGGKDSIVAGELLKEAACLPAGRGIDITAIFTETNRQSNLVNQVADTMGVNLLKIQRFLDWQVFQKHKYDGHIPISVIYAFLGIFYAVIYKYSYFVVANEYSSNFGNIKYKGFEINHQWSKSSEFENMFVDFVNKYISPDVKYFSLLRPFYEIRIAELFSKYKQYFPFFSSCNKNFKLVKEEKFGLWCGECPKCVFAFTMLSAFLTKEEMFLIFKKNLYQDKNLLQLFKDNMGLGKIKPFDCVGTFEESKAGFILGAKQYQNDFIIKTLLPRVKIKQQVSDNLFKTQKQNNIPVQLKFSGMKNVLILGYGIEGKITEKYIKKFYPNLEIGIADRSIDKNYLKKQNNYDIAIKTAGLPKNLVTIPYTTATNIFFSKIKELGNTTIGVTGSKGKSTTASLIYSILKGSGKNVRLVGNIGNPMLELLLEPIKPDEIFVIELSSYQLEDIEFSPDIAVVTNLFPEHMNYHNGLENYYTAKNNIARFQQEKDIFVYNPKNKLVVKWLKNIKSKAVVFSKEKLESKLIGEHNEDNIALAVSVAKELGIADEVIKRAVAEFSGLPHRLEFVGDFHGIKFYDDAISTSPESTIMAIKALKDVDTIFLGGEDRGYNFSELEKIIKKYKIKNAVVFPKSGNRIKLRGLNILKTKNMEKAVEFAYNHTRKGKICLLSCASPSYSLWKNFEEKGDRFKFFVKKLQNEKTL